MSDSFSEPLVLSMAEAIRVSGLGRSTVFDAVMSGQLRSVKIGRRRLIRPVDLRAWINSNLTPDPAAVENPAAPTAGEHVSV